MENAGKLDPDDEVDLLALHYVYIPLINSSLEEFRQTWMHHKLRTEGNKTPLQLWTTAITEGFPVDFEVSQIILRQ